MPSTNVNGVWRDATPMTCVNGVWRKSSDWTNINGVWRTKRTPSPITPANIEAFEIVYTRIKDIRYYDFPDLKDNRKIPSTARVGGGLPVEEYSTKPRSFILEYTNELPKEEGLAVYQGVILAKLKDGTLLNISEIFDNNMDCMPDISITITGYSTYESYGPDVLGWNRVFSTQDNLPSVYHDDKNTYLINSYPILPAYNRSDSYMFRSLLGIAREMSDRYINMVGSHGLLDHTYDIVEMNGEPMPFRITVYE